MSLLMNVNLVLAGLAFLLAAVVAVVYLRNYKSIRSPFTLALALFAVFLLVHNGVLVYHYLSMMATFGGLAEQLIFVEGVLEVAALGTLLYAVTR